MPLTTKRLTIENVNLDDEAEMTEFDQQVIAEGMKRVAADRAALRARGLLDVNGKLIVSRATRRHAARL